MAAERKSCTHMTSNANDLTARLRRRLETEREEIEELTASELERLGANSRRVASNTLRTIERDTAAATGRMRSLLLNAWLRPLLVGLSLWLGICGGSWATVQWLSTRIQARIQTVAALDLEIEEARRTWSGSRRPPGGSRSRRSMGTGSWCFRPGALAYPALDGGTRPAVKLSSE